MTTWHTYAAMVRFGLRFCDDMAAFDSFTAAQSEHMAACWREAPKVAREIWAMTDETKARLTNAV